MLSKDKGGPAGPQVADLLRRLLVAPLSAAEIETARPLLEEAGTEEIALAIDLLIAEGVALERLDPAVSKLVNLFGSSLSRRVFSPDDAFFSSLLAENRGLRAALDRLRPPLAELNRAETEEGRRRAAAILVRGLAELGPVSVHYEKKENILFPVFEKRHPRWRCVTLMWSLHDRVRGELAALPGALGSPGPLELPALNAAFGRLFFAAHAVIFREERILLPLVSGLLSREEREELYRESRALGFAFLDPAEIRALDGGLADRVSSPTGRGSPSLAGGRALALDAGALEPEVLDLVLKALPVDSTFVDAGDRVAWFSNGPHRIFPRSPAIIGRDVRNCHPAASLDRVMGIIESFRSGKKDSEDFWINHRGRFIYIRYVAVRDAGGAYLGTLESSQDLTELRALQGEKRLAASPGGAAGKAEA